MSRSPLGCVSVVAAVAWTIGAGCAGCACSNRPAQTTDAALDTRVADLSFDLGVDRGPPVDLGDGPQHPCGRGHLPSSPTKQTDPLTLGCGPGCRQISRHSSGLEYDLHGDVLTYSDDQRVYLIDVASGEEWLLCDREGTVICMRPATDGRRLGYIRYTPGHAGWFSHQQLFVFDTVTRQETELACTQFVCEVWPLAATDKALVAQLSPTGGCNRAVLYPFGGGTPKLLGDTDPGLYLDHSMVRAAGPRLVFRETKRLPKPGYERLVAYDTRNDTLTPLPDSRMHIWPRIDGEVVVAVVENQPGKSDGDTDIAIHDLAKGTLEVLKHPARQDSVDVSGNLVVWHDWRNNPGGIAPENGVGMTNTDVFLYDRTTGKETQLTCGASFESNPRIDGRRVVFRGVVKNVKAALFLVDLDTWDGKCIVPRVL